ncbi:YHS domain-containing protein [candidate division WOR-3 bacterium]|nr:YHS domain-containing protein [candidate division WOR-3 bacterium]
MDQKHEHKDEHKEGNLDPVCGMNVTAETAACSYQHKGRTFYFCAQSCRDQFAADPNRYTQPM